MKKMFLLPLLALSSSCANHINPIADTTAAPLTPAQKTQLSNTLTSVGRAQNAQDSAAASNSDSTLANSSANATGDVNQSKMASKLRDELQSNNCTLVVTPTPSSSPTPSPSVVPVSGYSTSVSLYGGNCPVSLYENSEVTSSDSPVSFHSDMDLSYNVNPIDTDYLSLNDITAIYLSGDLELTIAADHSSATGSGQIAGSFNSQMYGILPVTQSYNLASSKSTHTAHGTNTITIKFPDHTVALTDTINLDSSGKDTHQYTLNGETLSATDYQSYLKMLGPAFAHQPKYTSSAT